MEDLTALDEKYQQLRADGIPIYIGVSGYTIYSRKQT